MSPLLCHLIENHACTWYTSFFLPFACNFQESTEKKGGVYMGLDDVYIHACAPCVLTCNPPLSFPAKFGYEVLLKRVEIGSVCEANL